MKFSRNFQTVSARQSRARSLAAALAWSSAAAALAVAVAAPAHAQVSGASLRGTVKAEGGVSEVTAVNVNTGLTRTSTVSASGGYSFSSLPVGTYRLELTTPQGKRQTDEFALNVGQSAVLDFDFSQPDIAEGGDDAIIVTGSRIRSMEGGEVGSNISQRLIEVLPQNNRNFLAFADLAPGVQFLTNSAGQTSLRGGAQGANAINIFIDGIGQKDYVLKGGISGQDSTQGNPFPQLAIGEYRVISSNYKAEYDQVSSVAITAVTKSGTNEFHGEGFYDFTNQSLRDRLPRENFPTYIPKVRTKDTQFGGALGGPIIKDVLHFFVTYEGKRRVEPREIRPGLDLPVDFFPTQYRDAFGARTSSFNEDLYFGKINFTPTSNDLFEFSLKYRDESGKELNNGFNAEDTRTDIRVKEWRGLARWEHTADTWVNDFKVAYEDVSWNPRPLSFGNVSLFNVTVPNTPPATGTRRGDILRIGAGTNFQDKGQKGWQVSNDFTWTGLDSHTFKVGVKAKWIDLNTTTQNDVNPVFTYNALYPTGTAFNDTIPYRMTFSAPVDGGDPNIKSKNFQFGIYAQDDWEIDDRLTLNIGLRWDYERTPAFLNYQHDPAIAEFIAGRASYTGANGVVTPPYTNLVNANYDIDDYISTGKERKAFKGAWQPRLGFTYALDDEKRFSIFGGYGRSYDRTQFDFIQQELSQGLYASRTFNFNNAGDTTNVCTPSATCIAWDPRYLTPEGRASLIAGLPVGAGRELRFIKNDLKTPYSDQFSLGVRGRFNLLELEAGYSYVESKDGFAYVLGNRKTDGSFFVIDPRTGVPGSPFGQNPAPFGSLIIGTNGVETRANTAYFKLTKRYTEFSPWSLDATYTFTDAEENAKFDSPFALDFPGIEYYPFVAASGTRKHRFVMAGSVDMPMGFTLSGKFQIASPKYLTELVSTAATGTTPPTRDITSVETEGNGDRWGYRQMDLSITKYVPLRFLTEESRLRFRVDIINLFNDRNYGGFSAATGLRNQNDLSLDGPPRTIKLSAGFQF